MSNIILFAKSGSDWTENELNALNVTIETLDPISFFGSPLPAPTVDPIFLNNLKRPSGQISKDNRLFFRYLEDATSSFPSGSPAESSVDFVAFLLKIMDYDEPERVVHQRLEIGFLMCGHKVNAKPDVVIMDDENYILLVQEAKRHLSPDGAEPQLIAAAVAAYSANNRFRNALGLPPVTNPNLLGVGHCYQQCAVPSERYCC